jgi:hypothetical protein
MQDKTKAKQAMTRRCWVSAALTAIATATAITIFGWHLQTALVCVALGTSWLFTGLTLNKYKCVLLIEQITENSNERAISNRK